MTSILVPILLGPTFPVTGMLTDIEQSFVLLTNKHYSPSNGYVFGKSITVTQLYDTETDTIPQ